MRIQQLDILRGYAVALMLLDHALAVFWPGAGWAIASRLTVTRLAMPLFMSVAGALFALRGRPSAARQGKVIAAAAVASLCCWRVGLGVPEILAWYLLAVALAPVLVRWPAASIVVGVLQVVNLPLWQTRAVYQPGQVLAFVALGVLVAGKLTGRSLPAGAAASWLGRHALSLYVLHLLLLVGVERAMQGAGGPRAAGAGPAASRAHLGD